MKKICFLVLLLAASFSVPAHAQSPSTQGPTKVKGTLIVTSDITGQTKITAPQFCISTSCIVAWPTGGTTGGGCSLILTTNTGSGAATFNSGTCTLNIPQYAAADVTPPGSETRYLAAATCNGGVAFSSAFSTYDNQQPVAGCVAPATSTAAYFAFVAAPTASQYVASVVTPAPFWTGSDLTILFRSAATTGNVSWLLESGCTNPDGNVGTITWSAPVTITTAVSATANGVVYTARQVNFIVPGTNGCVAGNGTTAGSVATFRLHRSASDTAAGDAQLLGAMITTKRSQ